MKISRSLEKDIRVKRETGRLWKTKSCAQRFLGLKPCQISKMYKILEFHIDSVRKIQNIFCEWHGIHVDKRNFLKQYYSIVDKVCHFQQNNPSEDDMVTLMLFRSHYNPYFCSPLFLFYCWKINFRINGIKPFSKYFYKERLLIFYFVYLIWST